MKGVRRVVVMLGAVLLALLLVAGPGLATEAGGSGDEERQKWSPAETPYEMVGLVVLGVSAVGGGLALINARKQLRGERDQATGEFRWR